MPTVLTTWLGLHFGLILAHYPLVETRLKHWGVMSTICFALGWVISPVWAFNKQQVRRWCFLDLIACPLAPI